MSITDFASLKEAVQKYCFRSDTAFSNRIEDFIASAESRIYNGVGDEADPMYSEPLRCDKISTSTTVTMTSGSGTVPTDCLEIRLLHRDSDTIGLDYLSPDHFYRRSSHSDGGNPRWYTVEGSTIKTAPGGYDGDLNIVYYAKPTGISSSSPTNDVLTAFPELYLHATLFEAFSFTQHGEAAGGWLGRYRSTVSGINRSMKGTRHGGGKLVARPRYRIGS